MGVRNIKKQLAGVEDLLLGNGAQVQERNSGNVAITRITLLQPVPLISNLKDLDIEKYIYAMTTGQDTINDGNGGFYYLDELSTDTESLPDIVKPNNFNVGRWKRLTLKVN